MVSQNGISVNFLEENFFQVKEIRLKSTEQCMKSAYVLFLFMN